MKRKLLSLLLATVMLLGCVLPVFTMEAEATGESEELSVVMETIEIQTAEEFLAFARNCILDTWSQNKQVILTADISLAGKDFQPIATFGGSFEGNGHTISGLLVADEIVPAGLFRYLQSTAVVENLNVQGTVIPSGDAKFVGGIVGHNNGVLEHVTFSGTVEGSESVGGIAGYNNGTIRKCSAEGSLTGEKSTGGIAGYNTGLSESCENRMEVNTESVDPAIDPTDIDLDFTMDVSSLMNQNTSIAASDTGGICGYSAGMILGCRNTATIGYPHIGYNLGGIVGRNCGYVAACENTGTIYGRKDVGGIAGQIEPDIATILSPDYLQKLSDQFEQLGNLISSAGSAAGAAGSDIQSYIQTLAAYENQAKAALESIHSAMQDMFPPIGSGELPSAPDFSGFRSLASAIQGMVNTTQSMGQAMGSGIESMMGIIGAISGQVNSIAKTFEMATEDYRNHDEDVGYLKEALTDGRLTQERLDEAVKTILAFKAYLNLHQKPAMPPKEGLSVIGCKDHKQKAAEIIDNSITLVKNARNQLPLTPEKHKRIILFSLESGGLTSKIKDMLFGDKNKKPIEVLAEDLKKQGFEPTIFKLNYLKYLSKNGVNGKKAIAEYSCAEFAGMYDAAIILCNISSFSTTNERSLHWNIPMGSEIPWYATEMPTIAISVAHPFHLIDLAMVPTYINTYSASAEAIRQTVAKITGKSEFKGISPVDAFCGRWDTRV